jgi:hypothetical protein
MKHPIRIWKFLAAGVALAALQAAGVAFAAQPEIKQESAVVRAIKGEAAYRAPGQEWKLLKEGSVVAPGMDIRAGKDSNVDLFLNHNGPVVRVNAESILGLRKLDRWEKNGEVLTDTHLEVLAGSIMGYTQKLSPESTYLVTTPVCEVNVTGTHYQVTLEGYVIVLSGLVEVKFDRKQPVNEKYKALVSPGQTFDPTIGGVRATLPGDTLNLFADINTAKKNAQVFFLAGAKITVKPKKVKDVSEVKDKGKKGKDVDDD